MPLFTAETAREYARLSHLPTSARFRKPVASQPDPLPPQAARPAPAIQEACARVEKQLQLVDAALDKCKDSKEWDALTRAKERLFRCWVHLAGLPGPGNRKPSAERRDRSPVSGFGPLPAAEPAPVPSPAPVIEPAPAIEPTAPPA